DNGHKAKITVSGDQVTAKYLDEYRCDFRDGSGGFAVTYDDFTGTLSGNTIVGKTTFCSWGAGNPFGVGLEQTDFQVTISDDDLELDGTWHDMLNDSDQPMTRSEERRVGKECRDW